MKSNVEEQVDIVFPCFNSAQWIDIFIDDLLKFDYPNWRLIARDDGSKDATGDILRKWRDRLGPRMALVDGDGPSPNLGITGNYNKVLAATTSARVFTADPDDRWLPNRIPVTLAAMDAAEAEFGAHTPIAVGTDAEVVDADGNVVAPSYWRWTRGEPAARHTTPGTAMDSSALGSTMAFNRALLDLAMPMPKGAVYQDWWAALVAVAFGKLILKPDRTIRYLRHGANATKDPYTASLAGAVARLAAAPAGAKTRIDYLVRQAGGQAAAFADAYEHRLPGADLAALRALADLPNLGPLARRAALLRHGLWFNSPVKNLGLFALV